MRYFLLALASATLGLAVLLLGSLAKPGTDHLSQSTSPPARMSDEPALAVCFDEGTSPEYVAEWTRRLMREHSLDFRIGDRWGHTATNPSTGSQGDPITLTYSFVPDGVIIDGQPSQLFSRMNQLFGNQQTWQNLFAQIFERWSQVAGLRYVYEQDDGASFGQGSPGVLGVRGDVRIGSVSIDGPSNVLAYDYFPDIGDMVLDADENWASPSQNYIFLRNIVAHEHGHGWGLAHVCPTNSTKLLEPYYSSAFDGPQHDDIRGAQRNYGDTYETNDTYQTATNLGSLANDFTLQDVSLDDNLDVDYYKFSVPAGSGVTLLLSPVGYTYPEGPQNQDGSCGTSTDINTIDDQNLDLYLRNSTGSTILAQSATHPAGDSELIYRYQVPAQGDSFIVEVSGATANAVQLYRLNFDIFNLADPYFSVTPLDFDTTQLGQPVTLPIQVINPSSQSLDISSISTSAGFSVTPTGAQTVPPWASLDLSATYEASSLGISTGELTVLHNGPGGSLVCPLIGMSINGTLEFVTGANVEFGEVPINTMDSAGVVIRAQGNVPIGIFNLETTAPFSIVMALPIWLNPSQSLILRPRFAPTELGEFNGMMVITHSAPTSPDTIYFRGTGTPNLSADKPSEQIPASFRLQQNYPNPFNPSTTISFDLPKQSPVRLDVFDVNGRLVRQLVDGEVAAGHHTVQFDGSALPSGVYLYRLTASEYRGQGKMLLLK